jgi:hypothetical protein
VVICGFVLSQNAGVEAGLGWARCTLGSWLPSWHLLHTQVGVLAGCVIFQQALMLLCTTSTYSG